jgi:NADH:ubiquinone oxidoreductase subunit E
MTCGSGNGVGRRAPVANAILAAHDAWLAGGGAPPLHAAAASLGLTPDAFQAVVDFHRRIVARSADEPLVLCRGVTCRMAGAEALHAALKSRLGAAGALGRIVEVLCLSHCGDGPNMKLGKSVLCAGRAAVVEDDRPWRPESAGPRQVRAPD